MTTFTAEVIGDKTNILIAGNLLKKGLPIDFIHETTGPIDSHTELCKNSLEGTEWLKR